ncbi:MAG: 4-hydroxy-3-methylbut-2-enyl diphosphate reductase [Prevotellaceae bacterium]|jgi:4-hydroxy-3-methylbut-2-enyl diphosphate reductase|nr:4-hydroxy-3-methylbut-2-enyl diphosphate reductase [Prevotellaceae bacterium]
MIIEIDEHSGFCFGVVTAIQKAEEELKKDGVLYCLGDIVHNGSEVERLEKLGLITINHEQFERLHDAKVLLRAHGEPPSTYETARRNNITIIDATCPVVLLLQKKIKDEYDNTPANTQIVIFGKQGHAEVNGLVGQTGNRAIVVENKADLQKVDFTKPIRLFSQTTKSVEEFNEIVKEIKNHTNLSSDFYFNDTICRQVANRIPNIRQFAKNHDIIIFVSGRKSSNGKILFEECKKVNPNSYQIAEPDEIKPEWFTHASNVGICGATSTPKWLMEKAAKIISELKINS